MQTLKLITLTLSLGISITAFSQIPQERVINIIKYDPSNFRNVITNINDSTVLGTNYIIYSDNGESSTKYNGIEVLKSTKVTKRLKEDYFNKFPESIFDVGNNIFVLDLYPFYTNDTSLSRNKTFIKYIGVVKDTQTTYYRLNDTIGYSFNELLIKEYGSVENFIDEYTFYSKLGIKYNSMDKYNQVSLDLAKEFLKTDYYLYKETYPTEYTNMANLLCNQIDAKFYCSLSQETKNKIAEVLKNIPNDNHLPCPRAPLTNIETEIKDILKKDIDLKASDADIEHFFEEQTVERSQAFHLLTKHLFIEGHWNGYYPSDIEEYTIVSEMIYPDSKKK